ncbi:hypothetical protein [Neptunicoccus cionae]|uniref:hypothetical protein n=1 Tax=Neptunicoccus cionae TaxID=2035344 RepID=UPI000C78F792|nr:hypothetical protein [Amylibacter cionae]PLS21821.1 hypothetical protein C0U40_10075 [Amylibacter cionae]
MVKIFRDERAPGSYFRTAITLLLVTVIVSIGGVRLAAAQDESLLVKNKREIFENIEACEGYKLFLELKPVWRLNITECHPVAQLIIKNGNKPNLVFVDALIEKTPPASLLGAMVLTLDAVRHGDVITSFLNSEIAGRRMAMGMGQSADIERATLYSHLLYGIQLFAAQAACEERFNCGELQNFARITEMFGSEFEFLDPVAPQFALLCLLKTDGYVVPLRTVLASPRFRDCISKWKL